MRKFKVGDKVKINLDLSRETYVHEVLICNKRQGTITKTVGSLYYKTNISQTIVFKYDDLTLIEPRKTKQTENMEKNITITQELAKQLYPTAGEPMQLILEQNFTKEQLGIAPEKPNCWGDLENVSGWFVDDESIVYKRQGNWAGSEIDRNVFPEREQAEASIAIAQLLQLMRDPYWNGDWKPDWSAHTKKYFIFIYEGKSSKANKCHTSSILAFKDESKRDEFLESYRDLIEIAKPLL